MLFTKPENLNGTELRQELEAANITIGDRITVETDGSLNIEISAKDVAKAEVIVAAHNGTLVASEASISEKLASVGLSLDELKAALLA